MVQEKFRLDGRVAMVTGASSGLGWHFACVLATAGATVVAGARREERLRELVETIAAAGGRAVAVPLDVTSEVSVTAAFDQAEAEAGLVDLVVNNAGIGWGGRLEEMPATEWQRTLDTNLSGVHFTAAEAARRLIRAGKPGSIINIASILGLRVSPGNAAYNATKAAVIHLTRSQALEWARHGIRVNALCPGFFESEMTADMLASKHGQRLLRRVPMRRAGRHEELDGPLLLLASEAGSFMTGTTLVVDGGHLCSSL
ncbi:MAG: SDR family oxidoreductase [Gammaproteobacteria bacterium]|nr:MAG: SDR family oxidoreductase [Gammaproteobacteria bacterium]